MLDFLKTYKKYVGMAVVAVVCAAFVLFGNIDSVLPDDSDSLDIIGSSTARTGDLVVLTANKSNAKYHAWKIFPEVQYEVMENGHVLVTAFPANGTYTVVLAFGSGRSVSLSTHVVTVSGDNPKPPDNPDDPVNPDTPESPWAKWTADTVKAEVPAEGRSEQAAALAGRLRSLAAKIAAGAVKDEKSARVMLRATTNEALGVNASKWVGFSLKFSAYVEGYAERGDLKSLKQYQILFEQVADGLDAVAKEGK